MNESPPSPRVLGNRYEVGDLLGRGGMAEVHIGRDTRLGRVVAIKLLRTDLARDPVFQARFRREAQSAAGLNHPAIVAVYDTGEETIVESGGSSVALPYIVMEYVEGRTLRDLLREGRMLDVKQALDITAGVLSALDYSHRMGIVHRDIKPANVMLTANGDVKVMDFGIARALADVSATMTQTQAVIGTAQYLSPEQARGETVDARSDLYSAGCLLYELMTGRPPFVADSPVAVAYQHVRELPQSPSAYNPAIPEVVDRVVLHSLAKDREARYQTAAEFRGDVEAAVAGRSVAAAAATAALAAPQQVASAAPGGSSGATTEFIPAPGQGSTRAMQPLGQTMPQAPVGYGPPQNDHDLYARRADRRGAGGGGGRSGGGRGGFIALALAVVLLFAGAAYGVSYLVGRNSSGPVQVPRLAGLTQADATAQLQSAGLSAQIITEESTSVAKDRVIRTDPRAGVSTSRGTVVKVYVAAAASKVTIPDVKGQSEADARKALQDAGLRVASATDAVPGNGVDKGLVVGTSPTGGQSVARNTLVTLQVASGVIKVPDVIGLGSDEAIKALNAAGVENGAILVVQVPTNDKPENQVIDQDPKAKEVESLKQIKIWVAIPQTDQPTDTGQPSDTATDGQGGSGGQDQGNQGSQGGQDNGSAPPTQTP